MLNDLETAILNKLEIERRVRPISGVQLHSKPAKKSSKLNCGQCLCGSVGRAVTFDPRGPWFESSHWQKIIVNIFTVNCFEKTKKRKKWPGMTHQKTKL